MEILKIVITIIFVIDCIALSAVVLMQEGKSAGLGTIAGMADTYWGQNRGRSMEGTLVKVTKILAALFILSLIHISLYQTRPQSEPDRNPSELCSGGRYATGKRRDLVPKTI